jgi:hypothetical protein
MGGERRAIINDHLFEISGDQRPSPLSDSNYGNHLKILNRSSKGLNGTILYCGSHEKPEQVRFKIKVCGMLIDTVITLNIRIISMVAIVLLQRNEL